MLAIMALGALAAWQSDNIAKLWIYLMTLFAGGGFWDSCAGTGGDRTSGLRFRPSSAL